MGGVTIRELLDSGVIVSPYPVATGEVAFSGQRAVSPHLYCGVGGKCNEPVCRLTEGEPMTSLVCPHGLSYFKRDIGGEVVTVYGLLDRDRESKKKFAEAKAVSKAGHLVVRCADVLRWLQDIQTTKVAVDNLIEKGGIKAAAWMLHDTPTMIGRAKQILEGMVAPSSSTEVKTLYKIIRTVGDLFEVAQIWSNPESASYGSKRPCDFYRLLHGIEKFMNMNQESKVIQFQGTSHNKVRVHDSFALLPLMLVNNAVKYNSAPPSILEVGDVDNGVTMLVRSYGPLIEDEEKNSIFKRDARGKWAAKQNSEGEGLGLYVAYVIARAHGIKINVDSRRSGEERNGIPMAHNEFSFTLRRPSATPPPDGRR